MDGASRFGRFLLARVVVAAIFLIGAPIVYFIADNLPAEPITGPPADVVTMQFFDAFLSGDFDYTREISLFRFIVGS